MQYFLKIILSVFFLGFICITNSEAQIKTNKSIKPLTKEYSLGYRFLTNGWGIHLDKGKLLSESSKTTDKFNHVVFWQIEFGEQKDPKQIMRPVDESSYPTQKSKYIFGKINNFYTLKLGYGKRKMLAGKPEAGCYSIHLLYSGGLSLGLVKPYYLKAILNNTESIIKYEESTKNVFLNEYDIIGAAGFNNGLNKIQVLPGVQGKIGLHFDFITSRKTVLALETGINTELYSKDVVILANQKYHPYIFNLFVSIQIGTRN